MSVCSYCRRPRETDEFLGEQYCSNCIRHLRKK